MSDDVEDVGSIIFAESQGALRAYWRTNQQPVDTPVERMALLGTIWLKLVENNPKVGEEFGELIKKSCADFIENNWGFRPEFSGGDIKIYKIPEGAKPN